MVGEPTLGRFFAKSDLRGLFIEINDSLFLLLKI